MHKYAPGIMYNTTCYSSNHLFEDINTALRQLVRTQRKFSENSTKMRHRAVTATSSRNRPLNQLTSATRTILTTVPRFIINKHCADKARQDPRKFPREFQDDKDTTL